MTRMSHIMELIHLVVIHDVSVGRLTEYDIFWFSLVLVLIQFMSVDPRSGSDIDDNDLLQKLDYGNIK